IGRGLLRQVDGLATDGRRHLCVTAPQRLKRISDLRPAMERTELDFWPTVTPVVSVDGQLCLIGRLESLKFPRVGSLTVRGRLGRLRAASPDDRRRGRGHGNAQLRVEHDLALAPRVFQPKLSWEEAALALTRLELDDVADGHSLDVDVLRVGV